MLITNTSAIELIYENVEGIHIPAKYILAFHLDGIEKYTHCLPIDESDWMSKTNFLQVLISNDINDSGIKFDFDDIATEKELAVPLTERIKNRDDLVAVALLNEQGDRQTIYVHWGGDNPYFNSTTDNRLNKSGDVLVSYVEQDVDEIEAANIRLLQDEFLLNVIKKNKGLKNSEQ